MSHASTVPPAADAPSRWGRAAGLSALVMPAVLAAFSLYLLLGSLAMDTEGADFPGPDFFPLILAVAGLVIAAALAVEPPTTSTSGIRWGGLKGWPTMTRAAASATWSAADRAA